MFFGNPDCMPHIVSGIGNMITSFEGGLRRAFLKTPNGELSAGSVLAFCVPMGSMILCWLPLIFLGWGHPLLRYAAESLVCWQCLAIRSLEKAAVEVESALEDGDIASAREALGRITDCDTQVLQQDGIICAAVGAVAENTCDWIIAPLFWMAIGGAPLGVFYMAINTLDSMVGYKNAEYLYFGKASVWLNDVMSFIPKRLTTLLMVAATELHDTEKDNAWGVFNYKRLSSLNPAQSKTGCATSVGTRQNNETVLAGTAFEVPMINDAQIESVPQDIGRAVRLMLCTALLGLVAALPIRGAIWLWTLFA